MGQGYIRNDTPNNIADGNVIDAADLDGEFDSLVAAFEAATGHTHDGTAAEGGAITVVGPAQDYVGAAGDFSPKTDSVYDLGKTAVRWATNYIDDLDVTTNIVVGGTVDGRDVATDGTKLDTIETSATADQTGAEIKVAYEAEADTNAFTDALLTKLNGIETAADVTDTANVTAAGALMDSEVDADIKTLSLPASTTITTFAQTFLDDADAAAVRSTLGITGSAYDPAAVAITGGSITGITDLAVADGGTGSSTAAGARTNLGVAIGTDVQAYDANLPTWPATVDATEVGYLNGVTSAIQTQIDTKAPTASPTFTGVPAAPTAAPGTNTTQVATTAFVEAATGSLSSGALTFLATADAAGDATIDFTAFDGATYDAYRFVLSNVVPANDVVSLIFRTSTDGGSTYSAGGSSYEHILNGSRTAGDSSIPISEVMGSAAGEDGYSGTITVYGPHITTDRTRISAIGVAQENTSGSLEQAIVFGQRLAAEDVDAVRFLMSAGNIESGTITMYGIRNA